MQKIQLTTSFLVIVLLVPGMAFAQDDAELPHMSDTDSTVTKNEQLIEQYRIKALVTNEIPIDIVLDRVGDRWIDKYNSQEHFTQTQDAIHAHLDRNLGEYDDWDRKNAENMARIQNFETITDTIGFGHDLVLLLAQKQKLEEQYNATEQVRKYHEWIARQVTVPQTKNDIMEKLVEILGDRKYIALAQKQVKSFNELAQNGAVPNDLIQEDVQYWVFQMNISKCKLIEACDANILQERSKRPSDAIADTLALKHEFAPTGFWQYVLPEAHASDKRYVNYDLYAYLSSTLCMYNNCIESWHSRANTEDAIIDVDSYTGSNGELVHAGRGAIMYFYGSSCDTYSGSERILNDVTTTPYLAQKLRTEYSVSNISANSCASTSKYIKATHPWILGIQVKSTGSYYWVK